MSKEDQNITGIGWAFPPAFDLNSKQVNTVTGEKEVIQSLQILFGTNPGERILEQSFGCNIHAALFQNISLSEKTLLENSIQRAIASYEARITVNAIDVDISQATDGIIHIQIDFTIRTINSRHNIVYPFYIGEGTLMPKLF
ncbi:MAG: GPW/gp25 family protein [Bacteroidota bacterium]